MGITLVLTNQLLLFFPHFFVFTLLFFFVFVSFFPSIVLQPHNSTLLCYFTIVLVLQIMMIMSVLKCTFWFYIPSSLFFVYSSHYHPLLCITLTHTHTQPHTLTRTHNHTHTHTHTSFFLFFHLSLSLSSGHYIFAE